MKDTKARKIGVKVLKIFGWILLSVFGLLLLIIVAIQIPWVQNKLKQEAIGFIQDKIGTPVHLDHFSLSFPKKIVLTGLYLEDQEKDTLLYAGRVGVDTDLWGLMDNTIELNKIELENIVSTIKRSELDSAFNFDYILAAFAAPDTVPADTTATAWAFKLGEVELNDLSFRLNDALSGNHIRLKLGEFTLNAEKFDLDSAIIKFDRISVANLNTEIIQSKARESKPDSVEIIPEDSAAVAFNIGFNEIHLRNINADYTQQALGQIIHVNLPETSIIADAIDIKNQIVNLARISLSEPFISYQQLATPVTPPPPANPEAVRHNEAQEPWSLSLNALDLTGGKIQYYDANQPVQEKGIDFGNMVLSDVNTRLRNINYSGDEAYADISRFSFREKSGFRIRSFHASVAVLRESFSLKNFALLTGNSKLVIEADARYPSLDALATDISTVSGSITVESSSLSLRDLLYFNPALLDSIPLSLPENSTVGIDAMISGNTRDLTISRFQIHTLDNTSLFASGSIRDIVDPENMYLNVSVDRFYTTRQDVETLLVDSLIPPSIEIPRWISLNAVYKGTLSTPDINGILKSDLGAMHVNATMNLAGNVKENYRGEVRILDFFLGKLLRQPEQMGRLDMVATFNGSGLSVEELDALFKVRVNKFQYNGYTYRDFRLDGSMKKYFFSGEASLADENLNFVLTGDLDYSKDVPHYEFDLDLKNADFKKLQFTANPLKARGILEVNLSTPDFQKLNGDVGIRKFAIFNGEALYAVDSLLFASIDQEGQSEISVRSDIVSGDFKGTINIFTLPDLLTRHFNKYFSMHDTTYTEPVEDQRFRFDLVLKNTDLITEVLLPELEPFVPGEISGEFNSATDELKLNFMVSEINYAGIAFDSISFKAVSDSESFDFTLALQEILIDTLNIKSMRLAGNVMHDSIRTNFSILDAEQAEKYYLGGVFHSFEETFQFSFLKDQITLNYEKWDAPLYNSLTFTDHGLEPNNFYIGKQNERILLYKKNNADSTLSIAFREVHLENVTSLVEGTTPLSGVIDGELTLSSSQQSSFETNLNINDLAILEKTWGDLQLMVNKDGNKPMNFNLSLLGDDAELKADGFLSSDDDPVILVRANLPRLNLAIVEPLTMGQLRDMKGLLSGEFTMQGKLSDPELSGRLNFKDASFVSTFANSSFTLNDETIFLRGDDLVFNRFNIFDQRKNKATLDGLISSREEGGFDLKLNLTASDFQLLNTTEDDNELFYGNIRLNTTTSITGTSLAPVVRMNVSLTENSRLTYVVPQAERGVLEQKGIVVFIDKDALNDPFMRSIDPRDTVEMGFTGVDLTANIQLNGTELFNVVIDPVTGDRLSVQGNSTLTLHIDPTGDMQLTGRYEIEKGTYDLSFAKFVKRSFEIDKGSSITWSGDILNAEMDIRAIYEVETAPIDLVSNQVLEEELPLYKEQLPFHVYLILKGELLTPEISFALDMPERARNEFGGSVYAKIQDVNTREADLNKQVFALIVLKRFIADNPFESQAGGNFESSARKSVSKILSDQLNRLSSNVKGVELSFDLKSYDDYSTGSASNQTDLQLGLSKSLMNDRLVVKVSGNVNIEGENSQQNSFTDFIGDLALEYKLTEDGRFRITGFRNSNYDMINGDIIETGAGLIYIKDYDTLKELFKPNADKK